MKPPKTSWKQVKRLSRDFSSRFPHDAFLEDLLKGVWRVARDKDNPIRGNLVASALREVVGHTLHTLAPDIEVRQCIWFEQAKDTKTVTRRQRANYLVHAGLPQEFVQENLKIEIEDYVGALLEAIDDLSKATHVRAETILHKGNLVRFLIQKVLVGLLELLDTAAEARNDLKHAISEVMHNAVFENLISESIQELDELSTHTSVDGHQIDDVDVVEMNAEQVVYEVFGDVEVKLQYGSNSDVRKDIGLRMGDSYPYFAVVISRAANPMDIRAADVELKVDNSSFFE